MSMDLHGKGANFKRDLLGDVQEMVLKMLGGISATIGTQLGGVVISNEHRVLNFQGPGVLVSDDPGNRRTNVFIGGGGTGTAATTVVSDTTSLVFNLWNGSSNNAPPANWQTVAFADGAWANAVISPDDAVIRYISGTRMIWVSSPAGGVGAEALLRKHFTLPAGTMTSATVEVSVDTTLRGLYLNGNALVTPPLTYDNYGNPHTFIALTASQLNFGGDNVLAMWVADNVHAADPGGNFDFRVIVNQNGATGAGASTMSSLGADVTMTSANTFYDGPSLSLAAGTWLLIASVLVVSTTTVAVLGKLWDGTTAVASGEVTTPFNNFGEQLAISAIVSPGSTTTYKISCASNATGTVIKAAGIHNGSGNNASTLVAVKLV